MKPNPYPTPYQTPFDGGSSPPPNRTMFAHDLLIDVPMPIVTPRMILRPASPGDGSKLAAAKRESWSELSRWLTFAEKPVQSIDEQEEEAYVRRKASDFILPEDLWLLAFEREGGELIGTPIFTLASTGTACAARRDVG